MALKKDARNKLSFLETHSKAANVRRPRDTLRKNEAGPLVQLADSGAEMPYAQMEKMAPREYAADGGPDQP